MLMESQELFKLQSENLSSIKIDPDIMEVVKATLLNPTYIVDSTYKLFRLDYRGKRFYLMADNPGAYAFAPSVTTIIHKNMPMNPFLLKWWCELGYEQAKIEMKKSAVYGTLMHIVFSELLLGNVIEFDREIMEPNIRALCEKDNVNPESLDYDQMIRDIKKDVVGFINFIRDYQVEPIAIEIPLMYFTPNGNAASCIDLVCKMTLPKGKEPITAIIDFKSNRNAFYDDAVIQLFAYRDMWNQNFTELPVERIFNYGPKDFRIPIGKTVTPYRVQEQTSSDIGYRWNIYLEMFHRDGFAKIEPYTEIRNDPISLETDPSKVFEEIDLIKNILGEK